MPNPTVPAETTAPRPRDEKRSAVTFPDRLPKVGDHVLFRPWAAAPDDPPQHAVVARAFGMNVNLAVLTGTGSWIADGPIHFDGTGILAGHWSWPKDP